MRYRRWTWNDDGWMSIGRDGSSYSRPSDQLLHVFRDDELDELANAIEERLFGRDHRQQYNHEWILAILRNHGT